MLCDVPARTEEGRRAKARALRAYIPQRSGGGNYSSDDNLTWSLLHDVLGERPWPDSAEETLEAEKAEETAPECDVVPEATREQNLLEWASTVQGVKVVRILSGMTDPEQEAFLRAGERIAEGMPPEEAARLMHAELGVPGESGEVVHAVPE